MKSFAYILNFEYYILGFELSRGGHIFLVPEEILYCFFNFLFDKFWNNIYLSYVPKFVFKRIWFKTLYFHLKGSCTLFQILIFLNVICFVQLELSRTELPECTPSILTENCDHTIFLFYQFYFCYGPFHKDWLFEKFIFELEVPYSFKNTWILER